MYLICNFPAESLQHQRSVPEVHYCCGLVVLCHCVYFTLFSLFGFFLPGFVVVSDCLKVIDFLTRGFADEELEDRCRLHKLCYYRHRPFR